MTDTRRLGTFASFKHRDYRFFFSGSLVSNIGTWMQNVALGWLVFELTRSSRAVGVVNFLGGVPVIFLFMLAGVLSDHTDRRRLIVAGQVLLLVQAAAFGVLYQTHAITLAWVYGLTLFGGIVSAFMFPAWQAMVPDLVPRSELLNALALSSAQFNAARLMGPMLFAAVYAALGMAQVFYVNAASFLFVIAALAVIRPRQVRQDRPIGSPWRAFAVGLRYVREHRSVAMHLVTVAMVSFFGLAFSTLLPSLAATSLRLTGTGYSVLVGFNGMGALIGALGVASLPAGVHRERIIRYGMLVLGLGIAVLALSHRYMLSAGVLVVMGAAFLAANSSLNTDLQTAVPPELRGRVMSLFVLAFMGMMPFSALLFGTLGDALGDAPALLISAGMLLAYVAVLFVRPRLLCEDPHRPC